MRLSVRSEQAQPQRDAVQLTQGAAEALAELAGLARTNSATRAGRAPTAQVRSTMSCSDVLVSVGVGSAAGGLELEAWSSSDVIGSSALGSRCSALTFTQVLLAGPRPAGLR